MEFNRDEHTIHHILWTYIAEHNNIQYNYAA